MAGNILDLNLNAKYDVTAIGSSLMDFILNVDDSLLSELQLNKGQMHLINEEQSRSILEKIKTYNITTIPGGSAANTIAGLVNLGGKGAFIGKVGIDDYGKEYKEESEKFGVVTFLSKYIAMTGHAITFITPDGERTFATHLGSAIELTKDDINAEVIKNSKILHIEGYLLEGGPLKEAALEGMKIAKDNNIKISIDVSDPGLVVRAKNHLLDIIKEYADIVFANQDEAAALTNKSNEEDALKEISEMATIAVVKVGEEGSLISYDGKIQQIAPYKATVENTNGAGDMYAAGFLYGLVNDYSLDITGKIASFSAAKVVEVAGARLDYRLSLDEIL